MFLEHQKYTRLIKLAACLLILSTFSKDTLNAMNKNSSKGKEAMQKHVRCTQSSSNSSSRSSSSSSSYSEDEYFTNKEVTLRILAEAFENNQHDCLINFLAFYRTDNIVSEFAHEAIRRTNPLLLAQFLHIAPTLLEARNATGLTPLQLILTSNLQDTETMLRSFLRIITLIALENGVNVFDQINPQVNSELMARFIRFADDETLKHFLSSINDEELKIITSLLDAQLFNRVFDIDTQRVGRLLVERCYNFLAQLRAPAALAEPPQVNLMAEYQQLTLPQMPQAPQGFSINFY